MDKANAKSFEGAETPRLLDLCHRYLESGPVASLSSKVLPRSWGCRRAERTAAVRWICEPRSLVTVLVTPEEIEDAARRAAVFERAAASLLNGRVMHFEAMTASQLPDQQPDGLPSRSIESVEDESASSGQTSPSVPIPGQARFGEGRSAGSAARTTQRSRRASSQTQSSVVSSLQSS